MPRRRVTEAERMRRHNEEMRLALAENVTLLEARQLLAVRRWRKFEATFERRRRCGTADVASPAAAVEEGAPPPPDAPREPRFWWERY